MTNKFMWFSHITRLITVCNFVDLNKTCAAYYGNRSAAYLMAKDYSHALDDAKIAIQLDENYIKV